MRKGWQSRKIKENAWGLYFTRWYFIAPSGNKYFFYRGPYFDHVYIVVDFVYDSEFKRYDPNNPISISRNFNESLKYIYKIESEGGFPNQTFINDVLSKNTEMNYLFSKEKHTVKYDSM